jgi:hypothetical protein
MAPVCSHREGELVFSYFVTGDETATDRLDMSALYRYL